jgi:hypothetical protein
MSGAGLGWQDLAAAAAALVALAWLARGWWRRRHRATGGTCASCPVTDPENPDAWAMPRPRHLSGKQK